MSSKKVKKVKKQKKQKNVESESHPEVVAKNVDESESSIPQASLPEETAQETSQRQATQITSRKRKNLESESQSSSVSRRKSERLASQDLDLAISEQGSELISSQDLDLVSEQGSERIASQDLDLAISKRRSERIASQKSDLANLIRELGLNSGYVIEDLPSRASLFKKKDMEALRVNFCGAPAENAVIPDATVTIPDMFVQPNINGEMLSNLRFSVSNVTGLTDREVKTFFKKLHKVVTNSVQLLGTTEKFTDTLVDDLLRVAGLNKWPFSISNHPPCKLYIADDPYVSSEPEFVINKEDNNMEDVSILIVEDKHLKNVGPNTGFGETQISAEVLACVTENIRSFGRSNYADQTLWAVRVISSYVTFYKADIPARYLMELERGLPQQQSVRIQRWPANNDLRAGFDLAEPNGRRNVLTALAKIQSSLLHRN